MKHITYSISVLALLFFSACGHSHDHAHTEEAQDQSPSSEEVHLVQKQMDVMGIELGTFSYLELSNTVKASGQLELPPQNKASLSAVMGGRVVAIHALLGKAVRKGQVLATLEDPQFIDLQQEFLQAHSELTYKEADYRRQQQLHRDSINSTQQFQRAESDYLSALASYRGLKAKLNLLHLNTDAVERGEFSVTVPVVSPINGFVRQIEVNVGKYVQPQQELFEIVDNDHIHIDLMVYEKDMAKVEEGQKVVFTLTNQNAEVFEGKVFAVGKSFEQEPKAMVVHAEIDNHAGTILPGMYVDARIVTHSGKVQAVPQEALVSEGGLDYIFILQDAGDHAHTAGEDHPHEYIFKKVEVNTGVSDIGFTEAIPVDRLPGETKLVTKGAFYLLAEMNKGQGEDGHHH